MLIVASAAADPGALLRARLAGFPGFLRANGFGVGGGDAVRMLDAADLVGLFDRDLLRDSLKALLCGRGEEWRRFDALFDAYFLPPNRRAFPASIAEARAGSPRQGEAAVTLAASGEDAAGESDAIAHRHGASREESLASTDFRDLNRADEAREIEVLMRRLARRMKHLALRRERTFDRGRRLDVQGTIRRSVASGGTPFRIAWKDRRRVRPRLLLLLDVSRSMSAYSFFYLRLARALCAELADVRCYIFHTRIAAVDDALRDPDPWRSQERMHLLSEGFGGGTRIGECLDEFSRRDGARVAHSRTAAIVVSDGYDTGEPELLGGALAALRRRVRRLVWLNPLLDQPGFAPASRGMQAALPHLDLLAAGADLADIERILPRLIETLR
ncbi:MAG TPA: VWA domain-containing protein [Casimicrobiaceae bacterium]|nr:VWA domain-containing protein [Casimicrobiaceae bacterium]